MIFEFRVVAHDGASAQPSINATYFPATVTGSYWTSTTSMSGDSFARSVSFSNGQMGISNKTSSVRVRCVRGGP